MFCSNCGKQQDKETGKFCTGCGNPRRIEINNANTNNAEKVFKLSIKKIAKKNLPILLISFMFCLVLLFIFPPEEGVTEMIDVIIVFLVIMLLPYTAIILLDLPLREILLGETSLKITEDALFVSQKIQFHGGLYGGVSHELEHRVRHISNYEEKRKFIYVYGKVDIINEEHRSILPPQFQIENRVRIYKYYDDMHLLMKFLDEQVEKNNPKNRI